MVDQDGLPRFPPLPVGAAVSPRSASLLRLVQGLDTAALVVADDDIQAIVLFDCGEVLDGYLERAETTTTGADVLDALDGRSVTCARLYELPLPLLRMLSCWWRIPSQITIGPSRWMDGEMLVRSFARPDQRGLVGMRDGEGRSGVVFVDSGEILGAYRADGNRIGGLDEIVPLFADPRVVVVGRLIETSVARAADQDLLDAIERTVRAEMHDYADPAVAIFRSVPPTREGLLEAASQVAQMRIRMISPERMRVVADLTRRLIEGPV